VVATPSYLSRSAKLRKPQDLTEHACINFRLPTRGGIYPWEFEKKGREFRVRVDGQLIFNGVAPMLKAALDGFGIAYLPKDLVQPSIEKGKLLRLRCDPFRQKVCLSARR
jgi:DNA-binding transcriptional LysR family regulator